MCVCRSGITLRNSAAVNSKFVYKMDHRRRGDMVMICNKFFTKTDFAEREGCEFDEDALRDAFKVVGFNVKSHDNLTKEELFGTILDGRNCFGF